MVLSLLRNWTRTFPGISSRRGRSFRSDGALEAIVKASEERVPNIALYNYPSFSGAFSALFAHIFHSLLNLPCLILPFSSVHPFRVEDFYVEGLEKCYFFDFLGPKGFAVELLRQSSCQVVGFDHRKSALLKIPSTEGIDDIAFHVDIEKSSSTAAYEYFSARLANFRSSGEEALSLVNLKDQQRVEMVLKYIEDGDLRKWSLPGSRAFNIGLREWCNLNSITNPYMYKQLLEISSMDLISKGNFYISSRENAASKVLDKVFKVQLGRGLYGQCLGVRADGNSELTDEIGRQLSVKSATAGLRPIGAVIYMQRNNLKVCLRSTDGTTDTSEVAKTYGGGGSPSSSSFIIRMDEYNQWCSS